MAGEAHAIPLDTLPLSSTRTDEGIPNTSTGKDVLDLAEEGAYQSLKHVAGDELDKKTNLDNNALHIALIYGNWRSAEVLYQRRKRLLWDKNTWGETPLHLAAASWDGDVLRWLLTLLRNGFKQEGMEEWLGREEQVQDLLRMADLDENTALHRLVVKRKLLESNSKIICELAETMVNMNGDLTVLTNKVGETALYLAARTSCLEELVRILSSRPSYPEVCGNRCGRTPLHAAIRDCNEESAIILCKEKEEFIDVKDQCESTPLHYAVEFDCAKVVETLLKSSSSSSLEVSNRDGATPLHLAAAMGRLAILELFVEKSRDYLRLRDSKGRNLLHVAAEKGRRKVAEYILDMEQSELLLNQRDNDGNTPLHLTQRYNCELLRMLLRHPGVDLLVENNNGETLADMVFVRSTVPRNPRHESVPINEVMFFVLLFQAVTRSLGKPRYRRELMEVSKRCYRALHEWRMNKLAIVATLVCTVTFAAGLALPGGSSEGILPLLDKDINAVDLAFMFFVYFNTIAMYLSLIVIVFSRMPVDIAERYILQFTLGTDMVLSWSLVSFALAFASGITAYVVRYKPFVVILVWFCCILQIICVQFPVLREQLKYYTWISRGMLLKS